MSAAMSSVLNVSDPKFVIRSQDIDDMVSIDRRSVLDLCPPGTEHITVYGWEHCKYGELATILENYSKEAHQLPHPPIPARNWAVEKPRLTPAEFPIKRVYTCGELGDYRMAQSDGNTTVQGRQMNIVRYCLESEADRLRESLGKDVNEAGVKDDQQRHFSYICKAGVTNAVIENAKRIEENLAVNPFIFDIDIDANPWPSTPETIMTKEGANNDRVTNKELRRAWKLCYDPKVNPKIQAAAKKTFVFVKAKKSVDANGRPIQGAYTLEKIEAPWGADGNNPEWITAQKARATQHVDKPKNKEYQWRLQSTNFS